MKILLCLILLVPAAHCQQPDRTGEIRKVLTFEQPTGDRKILVDNLAGSITVEGYDGSDVQVVARRSTRAESEQKYQEAREDVTLDVDAKRDRIELVVLSPWRERWGGWNDRGYDYYGYQVKYDFELKVPRGVAVYLRTIDEGDITVRNVDGRFEVKNVNGEVRMTGLGGHGHASTVNGSLELAFTKRPMDDCAFRTVNGELDASFPESLSAVLVLKTFNGRAYTDFDISAIDPTPGKRVSKNGKTLFKLGDRYAVQVGTGGPKIAFDTLNGDINIRKHSGS